MGCGASTEDRKPRYRDDKEKKDAAGKDRSGLPKDEVGDIVLGTQKDRVKFEESVKIGEKEVEEEDKEAAQSEGGLGAPKLSRLQKKKPTQMERKKSTIYAHGYDSSHLAAAWTGVRDDGSGEDPGGPVGGGDLIRTASMMTTDTSGVYAPGGGLGGLGGSDASSSINSRMSVAKATKMGSDKSSANDIASSVGTTAGSRASALRDKAVNNRRGSVGGEAPEPSVKEMQKRFQEGVERGKENGVNSDPDQFAEEVRKNDAEILSSISLRRMKFICDCVDSYLLIVFSTIRNAPPPAPPLRQRIKSIVAAEDEEDEPELSFPIEVTVPHPQHSEKSVELRLDNLVPLEEEVAGDSFNSGGQEGATSPTGAGPSGFFNPVGGGGGPKSKEQQQDEVDALISLGIAE